MPGGSGVLVSLVAVLALSVVALVLMTKLRRARHDADEAEEVARRRLLALTGADGLAWPANVAASEVLEAAMRAVGEDAHGVARESEQTRPLPSALARDLVVVVSELLDNAIVFCDPEDVAISAKSARDGGVLVEVDDGGGGMDRDELRQANRVLKSATPPTLDDGFGLFLAGRLAHRHNLKVVLSQRDEGIRATVHVPATVMSSAGRDARRPAGQGSSRDAARTAAEAVARIQDPAETQRQPQQPRPAQPRTVAGGPGAGQDPRTATPPPARPRQTPQPTPPPTPPPTPAPMPPPAPPTAPMPQVPAASYQQQPPRRPAPPPPPAAPSPEQTAADVTASWTSPWDSEGRSLDDRLPESTPPPPAPASPGYGGSSYGGSQGTGGYGAPPRPPSYGSAPPPEHSPIFDSVASSWFDKPAEPEEQPPTWSSPADEGWTAAERLLDDPAPPPTGELPRREPMSRLMPGSVRGGGGGGGGSRPFRMTRPETASPDAWATYQDRVDEGRRSWPESGRGR